MLTWLNNNLIKPWVQVKLSIKTEQKILETGLL